MPPVPKPPPKQKKPPKGLQRKSPLRATKRPVHNSSTKLRRTLHEDKPTWLSATSWSTKKALAKAGKRALRLRAGDKRISDTFRAMECLCGCSSEPDPAHLRTRSDESTRHVDHLIIPLCRLGHRWLDHEAEGVQCRAVLFEMAMSKGQALTHAEFWPIADAYGMYGWMARQKSRGGAV